MGKKKSTKLVKSSDRPKGEVFAASIETLSHEPATDTKPQSPLPAAIISAKKGKKMEHQKLSKLKKFVDTVEELTNDVYVQTKTLDLGPKEKKAEINVQSESENDDSDVDIDESMNVEEIERRLQMASSGKGKKALFERARAVVERAEDDGDDDDDVVSESGEQETEGMEIDGENNPEESKDFNESDGWRRIARQRVLLVSSRGINHQHRHLFNDLHTFLPHSKKDAKIDSKSNLHILNELCELSNCNNCIFFEVRRKTDLYMWMSKAPNGPSIKFHVLNIHTMDELKMTGNCLKGSRPLLSFDKNFDSEPHFMLMKEVLKHLFNTPRGHRKSKPFIDHIVSFTIADNKIWFRNYQISTDPASNSSKPAEKPITLTEIGPRFVLTPIKIFDGSFGGRTLWSNDEYVTPTRMRLLERNAKSVKYKDRAKKQVERKVKKKELQLEENVVDKIFD